MCWALSPPLLLLLLLLVLGGVFCSLCTSIFYHEFQTLWSACTFTSIDVTYCVTRVGERHSLKFQGAGSAVKKRVGPNTGCRRMRANNRTMALHSEAAKNAFVSHNTPDLLRSASTLQKAKATAETAESNCRGGHVPCPSTTPLQWHASRACVWVAIGSWLAGYSQPTGSL